MMQTIKNLWRQLRHMTGDDRYECYLQHVAMHPHSHPVPMSKKDYFNQWQREKWHGIKRCC
jgi:uncharacterized short protein YbdD (DUF466 family)